VRNSLRHDATPASHTILPELQPWPVIETEDDNWIVSHICNPVEDLCRLINSARHCAPSLRVVLVLTCTRSYQPRPGDLSHPFKGIQPNEMPTAAAEEDESHIASSAITHGRVRGMFHTPASSKSSKILAIGSSTK
jgi:hypothetical protein